MIITLVVQKIEATDETDDVLVDDIDRNDIILEDFVSLSVYVGKCI